MASFRHGKIKTLAAREHCYGTKRARIEQDKFPSTQNHQPEI